jgi:hypothetical protein
MASGKLAGHDTPEKLFAELLGLGLKSGASRECVFHKDRKTAARWNSRSNPPARSGNRSAAPSAATHGGFSKEFGTLFAAMEKFAESVERHLDGILTHWKHGVTNAGGTQTACPVQ